MSAYTVRKKRHPVRRFLRGFFLILLAVSLIAGAGFFFYIRNVIAGSPELDLNRIIPSTAATYIYNQDNKRVQKLTLPESNRDLVSIDRIPEYLQNAFVAIEDSRYYKHNGIDLPGIARAFLTGLRTGSFSEGASTITQQLLKNSLFTGWTSESTFDDRLKRKIQEQYLALKLEKLLTKEQILEDYLNVINLGAGCYGVQSASYKYFGKDVSLLTLSESAVIAAITQNPSRYDPRRSPEANAARRKAVLDRMLAQGYISQTDYQEAMADHVYDRIQSNEVAPEEYSSIYTYYQDALIDQVLDDLINEKGYTSKQAYKAVYTGGLQIYSAQDDQMQAVCDEVFADPSNFPEETLVGIDYALSIQHSSGEVVHYGTGDLQKYIRETDDPAFNLMFDTEQEARDAAARFRGAMTVETDTVLGERVTVTAQPQASVVILDQSTGLVKALIGGRGTKEASLTLNRATYTTRQPGSTFKILTTYAPALDAGGKTLATMYDGSEYQLSDGSVISNWDLNADAGPVSIREAIVRSVNTAAVRCITEISPALGFSYAKSMGITSLVDHYVTDKETFSDVVPALALGGITNGVTNLELCNAYACIANGGTWRAPKFYTKVLGPYGEVLLDAASFQTKSVLKPSTAYLLTDAMRGVISDPEGTAYGEIDLGEMDAAGKTGTTSSYRDIWFAGYTPYYTCCVWGGYDNNDVLPSEGIGHTYQKKLWNSIMTKIHEDLPAKRFSMPYDIVTERVCTQTGDAASRRCPTGDELFAKDNLPSHVCSVHGDGRTYQSAYSGSQSSVSSNAGSSGQTPASGNPAANASGDPAGSASGNTSQQGVIDLSEENGMASDDGWVTFFENGAAPEEAPDLIQPDLQENDPILPDPQYENPIQADPQYENPIQSDPQYENPIQSDPQYENPVQSDPQGTWQDPSGGITIFSSDETVWPSGTQEFAVG